MALNDAQKRIVFHLGYEWWMFKSAHDLLMDIAPRYDDIKSDPVRNAMVEALAIHGRGLVSFFYGGKKEATDWHVSDLDATLARTWPPPTDLDEWRKDANERVAHLTDKREIALTAWKVPASRRLFQGCVDAMKAKLGADMPNTSPQWMGDDPTTSALVNFPRAVRPADDDGSTQQPTGPPQPLAAPSAPGRRSRGKWPIG
jgi:hypothetical protein